MWRSPSGVLLTSCVDDGPQEEHYCSRGKDCENGQYFIGTAKFQWDKTVGGMTNDGSNTSMD